MFQTTAAIGGSLITIDLVAAGGNAPAVCVVALFVVAISSRLFNRLTACRPSVNSLY